MNYERIEYAIRKGLGQDQWVVLIYFPDRADPTAVTFSGPRDDVDAVHVQGSTIGSSGTDQGANDRVKARHPLAEITAGEAPRALGTGGDRGRWQVAKLATSVTSSIEGVSMSSGNLMAPSPPAEQATAGQK
jgi:hypothetical protein